MFEQISNDSYILDIYQEIANKQEENIYEKFDIVHVKNVINIVENILKQLEFDINTIEHAKIAALLHDIGLSQGRDNYHLKSYEMASEYFINKRIDTGNNEEILNAIKYHIDGLEDNLIASILAFADKIDIKYTRLTEFGKRKKGLRQCYFVHNIIIKITDTTIKIMFLIDDNANRKEFEEYFFNSNFFKTINDFAKVINRTPYIYYNNEEWNLIKAN